MKLEVECSKF